MTLVILGETAFSEGPVVAEVWQSGKRQHSAPNARTHGGLWLRSRSGSVDGKSLGETSRLEGFLLKAGQLIGYQGWGIFAKQTQQDSC